MQGAYPDQSGLPDTPLYERAMDVLSGSLEDSSSLVRTWAADSLGKIVLARSSSGKIFFDFV